jgi:hypothetical protein
MKAASAASFGSAGASMACGWQDLPLRAADAYRHNQKLIGAVCRQEGPCRAAAPERLTQQAEVLLRGHYLGRGSRPWKVV